MRSGASPFSSGKRDDPFSAFRGGVLTASAVQVDGPQGAMKVKGKCFMAAEVVGNRKR